MVLILNPLSRPGVSVRVWLCSIFMGQKWSQWTMSHSLWHFRPENSTLVRRPGRKSLIRSWAKQIQTRKPGQKNKRFLTNWSGLVRSVRYVLLWFSGLWMPDSMVCGSLVNMVSAWEMTNIIKYRRGQLLWHLSHDSREMWIVWYVTYVICVTFYIWIINCNDLTIKNYRCNNRSLFSGHFISQKRNWKSFDFIK